MKILFQTQNYSFKGLQEQMGAMAKGLVSNINSKLTQDTFSKGTPYPNNNGHIIVKIEKVEMGNNNTDESNVKKAGKVLGTGAGGVGTYEIAKKTIKSTKPRVDISETGVDNIPDTDIATDVASNVEHTIGPDIEKNIETDIRPEMEPKVEPEISVESPEIEIEPTEIEIEPPEIELDPTDLFDPELPIEIV